MRAITNQNFGLLIAYVLPGFVALWGLSHVSATIAAWLGSSPTDMPTVGGFLYVTLASVGAGLTVSTMRWLVIDTIHHRTGIPAPDWDFTRLSERTAAYDVLIEIHYRYYQFYGNSLVAVWLAFVVRWSDVCLSIWEPVGVMALSPILWLGSRDTLRKYYRRTEAAMASAEPKIATELNPESVHAS